MTLGIKEKRTQDLKKYVDYALEKGFEGICTAECNFNDFDLELLKPYGEELGVIFKINDCPLDHEWHKPKAITYHGLVFSTKKVPEVSEDEKIYVTSKDYDLFNFCRKSWVCRLVYRMCGK